MSIRLRDSASGFSELELSTISLTQLEFRFEYIDRRTKKPSVLYFHIGTKELVMAIKQIEEERDAHRESTERLREESGFLEHTGRLKKAVHRAYTELREVFRDIGPESPHYTEAIETVRSLYEAETFDKINDIVRRAKEKYPRPDRP